MIIVFVEDKALKVFISKLCGRLGIPCSPRMPRTGGGGWSCVITRIIGIIEGDAKKHAEKTESWSTVSDRIFITQKTELEEYLYDKRSEFSSVLDLPEQIPYDAFKNFLNTDSQDSTLNRILSALSRQECEEIDSLIKFIKGF